MSSRIRDNPINLFDVFLEIAAPTGTKKPWVLWKYPEDYDNEKLLKSVVEFAFPCDMTSEAVQLFAFVFTDADSKYSFGFCRHTPRSNTCLCVLSYLPWYEVFYKLLNHVADIMNNKPQEDLDAILTNAFHQTVPKPGETLVIETSWSKNKLEVLCPDTTKLPRIPDSRNLTEYYNAVDEVNMIAVFASMLRERRIVFISRRISQLSSCVIAANMLIYPMHWQHIFIPVLPADLFHYLHAPMPFLIGVHTASMEKAAKEVDLSECVILNIDSKEFRSPYNDFAEMPHEVQSTLKKNLKNCNHLLGDGLARSFLRAVVALIGNYRAGFHLRPGEPITFDFETYVKSRPPSMEAYMMEKISQLQIFQQFIEERLDILNTGQGLKDEFEEESSLYSGDKDSGQFKQQYDIWKREGKDIYKTFKKKVRDKGKETLSDFKGKINSLKDEKPPSPLSTLRMKKPSGKPTRPASVPANMAKKFMASSMVMKKPDLKLFEGINFDPFHYSTNKDSDDSGSDIARTTEEPRAEMEEMLNKRSSLDEELEALQNSVDNPVFQAVKKSSGQSVSCDDLLQLNGDEPTAPTNGPDFRTELNEIFGRSLVTAAGSMPPTPARVVPTNGSIGEPFPRPNSSSPLSGLRSPPTFLLPAIRPAAGSFPSSHSATDFRATRSAPVAPPRNPAKIRFPHVVQQTDASRQSSLSSLDSLSSIRSLSLRPAAEPTGSPPPTLLIDLGLGPTVPKTLEDVIFDPLLDPSRTEVAKVAKKVPVAIVSPMLPVKPSKEMPVIRPLTNCHSSAGAGPPRTDETRSGWEKFE